MMKSEYKLAWVKPTLRRLDVSQELIDLFARDIVTQRLPLGARDSAIPMDVDDGVRSR